MYHLKSTSHIYVVSPNIILAGNLESHFNNAIVIVNIEIISHKYS